MDRCPVELWSSIFSFACTDGGSTGRSLALAARWTNNLSLPFRLQSISATNTKQIVSLANVLDMAHPNHRRVRSLVLSNAQITHFTSGDGKIHQTMYGVDTCTSQQESFIIAHAILRILTAVADTLYTLDMDFSQSDSIPCFPYTLVPTALPHLVELRLKGTRSAPTLPAPMRPLPSLKRLDIHLTKCHRWGIEEWSLLEDLPSIAPELDVLYATGLVWCGNLPEYLRRTTFSYRQTHTSAGDMMTTPLTASEALFRRLKVIVVPEPPTNVVLNEIAVREKYERVMGELEAMAQSDTEGRLVVMSDLGSCW